VKTALNSVTQSSGKKTKLLGDLKMVVADYERVSQNCVNREKEILTYMRTSLGGRKKIPDAVMNFILFFPLGILFIRPYY
jgi:hypothetical protein